MKPFILLNKPQGITPLEAINRFVTLHPQYSQVKLGVAGRLDPMAQGLLIVLIGEENKRRKYYEQLQKTYEVDILFGFATDSYDVLGLVVHHNHNTVVPLEIIQQSLDSFPRSFDQEYPPYSAKPVNGKPLYWYARHKKLSDITLPSKHVYIYSMYLHSVTNINRDDLQATIIRRVGALQGDFRQAETIETWNRTLDSCKNERYSIARISITCSSGTYMRSLAVVFGSRIDVPALAYSIIRTRVGDYSLDQSEIV